MNVFELAFYRAARQRMTPDEAETAQLLATQADAGNASAAATLRAMCERIVRRKAQENGDRS